VRRSLWREGELYAFEGLGRATQPAFLDDHVGLADAALELAANRFDAGLVEFAAQLMDRVQARFAAPGGGWYFTADEAEPLIHRSLRFDDDATPAGAAVAVRVLLRLGHLLGRESYLAAAEAALKAAGRAPVEQPLGHLTMIESLAEYLAQPRFVVLRGTSELLAQWQAALRQHYLPRELVLAIPADAHDLPPALATREPRGPIVAYVCRGSTCAAPVTALPDLLALLEVATDGEEQRPVA
jgi:uncharacterized protein YyaL (SSP411 family)